MNTNRLRSTFHEEVEEIEVQVVRAQRLGWATLAGWMQFVLDYTRCYGFSWDAVIENPTLVEQLNVKWMKARTRFR